MSLLQGCRFALNGLLWRWRQMPASDPRDDLDCLPLALVRLDEAGRMSRLSNGWERLSGHRCGDCLSRRLVDFIHIEDQPHWNQALEALRTGQSERVFVLRYLTHAGELRWVEVRLCRQHQGFLASLADVSAQIPGHRRLEASHRSLNNLLDGLPMMVYRCRNNRDWTMEYVSAGCLALTGYSVERLVDNRSLTYNSLIHVADREHVWQEIQRALRTRQRFTIEYRLVGADAHPKAVQERGCGIYSDAGEVLGLEGVVMEQARTVRQSGR